MNWDWDKLTMYYHQYFFMDSHSILLFVVWITHLESLMMELCMLGDGMTMVNMEMVLLKNNTFL